MRRRDILRWAAGTAAGLPAWCSLAGSQAVRPDGPPRRLIVVLLRGALDGLSAVVPYADPAYYRARSSIALARPGEDGGVLDLDGRFGLHPALAPLLPFWRSNRLAFVHAAGSPDATRSHFDAQDYMESGTPGRKATADGWLNRLLGELPESAPAGASTLRAIGVGPLLPRILRGPQQAANIPLKRAAGRKTLGDIPAASAAFDELYGGDDKMSRLYRDSRRAQREVRDSMAAADTDAHGAAADNGAPLPHGFADDAGRLGKLMREDANVEIACMALGGWDTHARQGAATGLLASRLGSLAQGLARLAGDLGPVFEHSIVVVMSEFGRTVRQNGNGGTDHGHGNALWLLGGPVAGGAVHGAWPGLEDSALYEGRDLAVTTDFRAVLAQVAERHLGLPDARLARVFPLAPEVPAGLHVVRG